MSVPSPEVTLHPCIWQRSMPRLSILLMYGSWTSTISRPSTPTGCKMSRQREENCETLGSFPYSSLHCVIRRTSCFLVSASKSVPHTTRNVEKNCRESCSSNAKPRQPGCQMSSRRRFAKNLCRSAPAGFFANRRKCGLSTISSRSTAMCTTPSPSGARVEKFLRRAVCGSLSSERFHKSGDVPRSKVTAASRRSECESVHTLRTTYL